MRRIAWILLLLFAFAIPWEYSLDLGEPLGNIARIVGILLLLVAIPAVLQSRRVRTPGPMQWLALALFLWLCCTYFWTIETQTTLDSLRGYLQTMMIVWLVWEFAERPGDLRALLRATIAGSWVLAVLTLANLASADAIANGQIRFAATGQDPNDVARFLDLGFPLAALLLHSEGRWPWRLLAAGYLPLGFVAVLLTASRGGFLAAVVALAGSIVLLGYGHPRRVLAGTVALPPLAAIVWLAVPRETFERLGTISEQLHGGDLNQRMNIWVAGWHAFVQAPFFGGLVCLGCRFGAPGYGAQYGAFNYRFRRALRTLPRGGHRRCRDRVHTANPRPVALGACHGARGLAHHFAGRHRRREPHHVASAGPDCARRAAGRRTT
jgi:O-antigen ligase